MVTIPFLLHSSNKGREEKGALISLFVNSIVDYDTDKPLPYPFKGALVAGSTNLTGNFTGAEIAGLANVCNGSLTGVSIGTVNYAKINGRFAVQVGGFNHITDYNPDGTVIQVGLYNRVGNQTMPLVNIRRRKGLERKV